MNRSPIDRLMDKVDWHCVRCGAPMGTCECWVKVKLRCPRCERSQLVTREPHDPPGTAVVEYPCPQCDKIYDRATPQYYDARGNWFDGKKFRRIRSKR
jgi:hypothetical protein